MNDIINLCSDVVLKNKDTTLVIKYDYLSNELYTTTFSNINNTPICLDDALKSLKFNDEEIKKIKHLDTLCDRLQNIDIPKEDELINDFIDSISNIYKLTDITLDDIYDAVYTSIISFNDKHDNLDKLELSLFKDYIDEALTKEYFGFINDRLKSGYYMNK